METVSLVIHVLAAATLVGPQILLFLAVVPATWIIDDEWTRARVTRVVTARFGMIAGISVIALLVTGLYQFYALTPDRITEDMTQFRYGWIFMTKMTGFVVLLILVALHAFWLGRQIRQLSEEVLAGRASPDELEAKRRTSFMVSFFLLVASVFVLVFGVMLGHPEFSYVPTE